MREGFTGERLSEVDGEFGVDLERHLAAYRFARARAAGRTVLDAGCGEGYGAALLAEVAVRVVGADRMEAIALARARHRDPRLELRAIDLERLDGLDGRFDLVVSFQVIEHLPDPVGFLAALARRAAPGGEILVTTPNRLMSVSENPYHLRGWPRTARRHAHGAMCRRVLLAAGVALVATVGCRSVPAPTGDRVLLIGIDAATWDVIRPLAAAGRLPTLARLVAEGWSAPLRSMEPTISPRIWTTIATGKLPEQHGIEGFLAPAANGSQMPVTSNLRRAETLWTIASRAGRTVDVVGWYVTWPVEPVNGVMVADRFIPEELDSALAGGPGSLTAEHPGVYPVALAPELERLFVRPEDFVTAHERLFHKQFKMYPVDATRTAIAER